MAGILFKGIVTLAIAGLINILYSWYQVRMHVRRVKTKYGVDILPHSFLWGHLLVIDQVMRKSKLPPNLHSHWLPLLFLKEYPELAKKGILYLDVWPISEPLLAIYDPDMLMQVTDGNFPKSKLMVMEMGPVTDAKDLLTMEGQQWKKARAIFNPGFSSKNLTSLIPEFVEEIETFRQKMKDVADTGKVIKLEEWTTMMAVDVIGRAVLGARFNSQIKTPVLIEIILAQIPLLYNKLDPFKLLNPFRYYKLWLYRRRFRTALIPYIQNTLTSSSTRSPTTGPKTILNLALKEYTSSTTSSSLNDDITTFIESCVGHFWIFIFAGHDTTATTLSYALYLLGRNPHCAARLRAEHDTVLGPDPSTAASTFKTNPALINSLPYTAAVIKETLRLYHPVAGGVRSTTPGFFVTHPVTGERFPTWGFMVNSSGAVMSRLPSLWADANSFVPERWLIRDPADPLYPVKGAWRPFEAGPRNCIGQELVMYEVKMALALVVREFEVEGAYDDDDDDDRAGLEFLGEKAYQVDLPEAVVTAHARGKMPVRVRSRGGGDVESPR